MSDTLEQRQYDRGHAEQTAALRSGQLSLAEAIHRLPSQETAPRVGQVLLRAYNAGARAATEDHIKRLERAGASS